MPQSIKFWLRHPSQAAWLIAVLAVATAIATATWSIGYGLWLEPMAYRDPGRLVSVGTVSDDDAQHQPLTSIPEYQDWQAATGGFMTIASWDNHWGLYLFGADGVLDVHATAVTTNILDVLGVEPALGHDFRPDDGAATVRSVIISDHLWRTAFGTDSEIVGRPVRLRSWLGEITDATVIGVLPPHARIPMQGDTADLILATTDGVRPDKITSRSAAYERTIIGRLAPGVTLAEANARFTLVLRAIDHDHPIARRIRSASLVSLHDYLYGSSRQFLLLLAVAALLVIVVTSANAAGVMLALMSRRGRELAVRAAVGASRTRLFGQMLSEAAVVAAAAAVIAIGLAAGLVHMFVVWAPRDIPRLEDITLDVRACAIAITLSAVFSLFLGLLPSVARGQRDLVGALQQSGVAATPSRRILTSRRLAIAVQVALVLALLGAAGLVSGTLRRLLSQPLGFDPDRVLIAEVVPTRPYFEEPARYQAFLEAVRTAVQSAPGHRVTALAFDPPLGRGSRVRVDFLDRPGKFTATKMISEGFFDVIGTRLLAGQDFDRSQYRTGDFVIVNESFARAYMGGVIRAVGREIILGANHTRIVGVAANVRERGITDAIEPVIYPLLSAQRWTPGRFYVVTRESGRGRVAEPVDEVARAAQRVDTTAHVTASALRDRLIAQTALARTQTAALGLLGAFTLALAALGILATIAQIVEDRQRELGIRLALGASATSLVRLVIRGVVGPVALGLAAGLSLSWLVARVVRQFLFNMSPFDPMTWAAAVGLLLAVSGFAAWWPARGAGRVEPASVLRQG